LREFFLAKTMSIGLNRAGETCGVGTYQASPPRRSETSQIALTQYPALPIGPQILVMAKSAGT